jgi:hypothetical protein
VKRFDFRIVLGLILLLGGGLLLLQSMGYMQNAGNFFWGAVFIVAGAVFLSLVFGGQWWGVFPGMSLLAVGSVILLGDRVGDFAGLIILGGLAIAFWLVCMLDPSKWWAVIPAGVLSTLAIVTIIPDRIGAFGTGGVFFLGLALTFLLVAIVTGMRWAYYPAAVLGVIGLLATVSLLDVANYVWAVVLIGAGGYLLFRYFRNR